MSGIAYATKNWRHCIILQICVALTKPNKRTWRQHRKRTFAFSRLLKVIVNEGTEQSRKSMSSSQGHECTTNAMDWAAAFGQTEAVKWLSQNRAEGCTKDAMGEGLFPCLLSQR